MKLSHLPQENNPKEIKVTVSLSLFWNPNYFA